MVIGYGFSRFRAIVKASDRANRSPRSRHFRRRAESDRGMPIVLKPRRRRRRQRMVRDGGAATTVLLLGLILAVALWWLKFGAKALG